MHECRDFQEFIWQSVETGTLPPNVEQTLGQCAACARELAAAKSAAEGFGVLRAVKAPCVRHVTLPENSGLRVWPKMGLAVGAAAIVLLALLGLQRFDLAPDISEPSSVVAHHPAPIERVPENPTAQENAVQAAEPVIASGKVIRSRPQPLKQNAKRVLPAKGESQELTAELVSTQTDKKDGATNDLSFPIEYRADETRDALALAVKSEAGYIMTLVPEM